MSTIFTKIITRQIPAYVLAEDEEFIAFLDIQPIVAGHTLVVPKQEIDNLFDLPEDVLARLLPFTKKVSTGLEKTIPCIRIGIAVIGLEIPHAHLHLIPLQEANDMNFTKCPLVYTPTELEAMAATIRSKIAEANDY